MRRRKAGIDQTTPALHPIEARSQMSTPKDGGPAFPAHVPEGERLPDGYPLSSAYTQEGMTLRDYFAAKAMAAIALELINNHDGDENVPRSIAMSSYEIADAMLEARK